MSICIALTIISVVNSANNYISERKLAKLLILSDASWIVKVVRNGYQMVVHASKLVVGDIYEVKMGAQIPAESVLVKGHVFIDESPLTGESDIKEKKPVNKDN